MGVCKNCGSNHGRKAPCRFKAGLEQVQQRLARPADGSKTGLPAMLYHGTSKLRWEMLIRFQGLKGNSVRFYEADADGSDRSTVGWNYFTNLPDDAAMYGLHTHYLDMKRPDTAMLMKEYPDMWELVDAATIIGIKTAGIEDRFELDPECDEMYGLMVPGVAWYRVKGDIAPAHLVGLHDVPYKLNSESALFKEVQQHLEIAHAVGAMKPVGLDRPFNDELKGVVGGILARAKAAKRAGGGLKIG